MKTFSDLLDIDTDHLLTVQVTLRQHGQVAYKFTINGINTVNAKLSLFDNIQLECRVLEVEAGAGVEILQVTVNGIDIMQSSYLNEVSVWQVNIPAPFYAWYHQISGQGWLLKPYESI